MHEPGVIEIIVPEMCILLSRGLFIQSTEKGLFIQSTECLLLSFILNSSQGALLDGGLRLNPCRTRWFAMLFFLFISFFASHLILWFPAVRKGESRGGSYLSVWEASWFQAMEYDDKSPELERIKPRHQSCPPPNIAPSFQFACGSRPDLPECLKTRESQFGHFQGKV